MIPDNILLRELEEILKSQTLNIVDDITELKRAEVCRLTLQPLWSHMTMRLSVNAARHHHQLEQGR
jgi:hypothetical protein